MAGIQKSIKKPTKQQFLNLMNGSNTTRPVPAPRKSKDGTFIMKRIDTGQSSRQVDLSIERRSDSHTDESLGNLFSTKEAKIKQNAVIPNVSRSSSGESFNESLGLLRKSASDSSLSSHKRPVTKHVKPNEKAHGITQSQEFEEFAKHGLVVSSGNSNTRKTPQAAPRQRVVAKQVQLVGNKNIAETNPQSQEFANQGLLLKQSLGNESGSVTSAGHRTAKQVSIGRDGKKEVNYSSDFEEYSISTLQSLGDNANSGNRSEPTQRTKVVELHSDGKKHVSYTKDIEEFMSHTLDELSECTDAKIMVNKKPRQVVSSVNTSDGEKSFFYSSDFDTQSLANLRSQSNISEPDLNTVTKSRDKEVTSWVEFREGKKQVRYSDEFENFSLGQAVQFVSKPKRKGQTHKQVQYRDGKMSATYSKDLQNSLQTTYSDEFESFSESWAMKVKRSAADLSPVTKHVEYKQGKKHVTYSTALENNLEQTLEEDETVASFSEIALEDLEDATYTEDFESTTAKGPLTARSIASASLTEDIDQFSNSTLTPHTSIQTSIHAYSDQYSTHNKDREHGLHSESFASVTSIPRSESAEIGEESSILQSPRYRTRRDQFSSTGSLIESDTEDESYTMTFSHPTAESFEESPEEKRLAEQAQDMFVKQRLKVLRTQKGKAAPVVPRPGRQQKLEGAEEKQMKKFLRNKLKVLQTKKEEDTPEPETLHVASCQLRGINLDEPVEQSGISRSAIIRLNMENTLCNMQKALDEEMHDPRTCPHCSDEMAQLAAEQFMWHKKAIVSEKLVKEKMEMQMLQLQDPMWLYAEALRGLPKPTDHRDDVYGKLMRPLFDSYDKNNEKETLHTNM